MLTAILPPQAFPIAPSFQMTQQLSESVPTYEQSPNDPSAIAYRIMCTGNTYELKCDITGESYRFTNLEETNKSSSSKDSPRPMDVSHSASLGSPIISLGHVSCITRKKLNLTKREPFVNLVSTHGKIPLTLFRGNYCGYAHPTEKIEYYWQLRNKADTRRETHKFLLRDAVLRRTVIGERSTITGMYLPHDKTTVATENVSTLGNMMRDDVSVESTPAYDHPLGRLLVTSHLDAFDKDMTVISFIAVLIRVIEAEKKTPLGSSLVRALTIGGVS